MFGHALLGHALLGGSVGDGAGRLLGLRDERPRVVAAPGDDLPARLRVEVDVLVAGTDPVPAPRAGKPLGAVGTEARPGP
ncbi:hypothetical protein ACWD4J_38060, partial [Streptomyces sp. NPDC002577]